jgi:hypothetical protein
MTTSITTFKNGVWITKTTDDNGNVVTSISDTQPSNATPNTEQCDANTGTATAETVDKPFVSNQCKGVIYTTENLVDKKTGTSIKIKRDANGRITPESQKELDKVQEARSEKILANNRKIQEARDKVNAEKAADAANDAKGIGVSVETSLKLPNGREIFNVDGSLGYKPTGTGVDVKVLDLGGKAAQKVGVNEDLNPWFKFEFKVNASESVLIRALGPDKAAAVKTVNDAKDKFDKAKEDVVADSVKEGLDGKSPAEINAARMKEAADKIRALGEDVGIPVRK